MQLIRRHTKRFLCLSVAAASLFAALLYMLAIGFPSGSHLPVCIPTFNPETKMLSLAGRLESGYVSKAWISADKADENQLTLHVNRVPSPLFHSSQEFSISLPVTEKQVIYLPDLSGLFPAFHVDGSLSIAIGEYRDGEMVHQTELNGLSDEPSRLISLIANAEPASCEPLDIPCQVKDYLYIHMPFVFDGVDETNCNSFIYQTEEGYILQTDGGILKQLTDSDVANLRACFAEDYSNRLI